MHVLVRLDAKIVALSPSGLQSHGPARGFGPDVAIGNLSTWWVYLTGPAAGAVIAVGVAYILRGPGRVREASAAQGTPLDRDA